MMRLPPSLVAPAQATPESSPSLERHNLLLTCTTDTTRTLLVLVRAPFPTAWARPGALGLCAPGHGLSSSS